jgi:hypothetical protein
LKVENVIEQAVEMVGPEMSSLPHVDQLCGYAHPVAALSHRTFEHIADAQFAPDLLHVDCPPFVSEG